MRTQAKSKLLISFYLIMFALFFFSCKDIQHTEQTFKSDFSTSEPRIWIGLEYWSNPMQDWQIVDGKLECLVSKKNRNVHVLTKKLDSVKGSFKMNVSLQLFNTDSS